MGVGERFQRAVELYRQPGKRQIAEGLSALHVLKRRLRRLTHFVEQIVFSAKIGEQFTLRTEFALDRHDFGSQVVVDAAFVEQFLT